MPTKEQIESVMERLQEVIASDYFEKDGDIFRHENGSSATEPMLAVTSEESTPFSALGSGDKIDVLDMYVGWEGFTEAQEDDVIRRVMDGESADFWLDGIEADDPVMDYRAELSSMMADIAVPPRFDSPSGHSDYDKALDEAASRGLSEVKDKDRGPER